MDAQKTFHLHGNTIEPQNHMVYKVEGSFKSRRPWADRSFKRTDPPGSAEIAGYQKALQLLCHHQTRTIAWKNASLATYTHSKLFGPGGAGLRPAFGERILIY